MFSKKIIFIIGPTGVGKTQVAFLLAGKLKGAIISCDAMQVYREANIASNKPSHKMLKEIPHHLINIICVEQNFNVATFNLLARAAIQQIHRENKIPIVTGGSGLYMSILLDGIFKGAGRNIKLRQVLQKEAEEKGKESLYGKLLLVDAQAAFSIHPHDTKKIIRALEVFADKKKPLSTVKKNRDGLWGKYDIRIFALSRARDDLYERINERVERMFSEGLVNEVEALMNQRLSDTAKSVIGIKEVTGFLEGQFSLERAQYLMKLNTRHYAKRQLTWFRKEKRLEWVHIERNEPPQATAEKILEILSTQ